MNTSITVPFHGNTLFLVEHNGEAYTPMKPIVEGMGLNWKSQYVKLKQRFASTMVEITTVAEDGKQRSMTCLLLRKLTGWLYTISPNKVKPELRERIIAYQAECDDVLWDYWNKGNAANPRYRPEQTREVHLLGLSKDHQDAVKAHHKAIVSAAPADKRAKLSITLWSSVKSKFGCSYKDVPDSDFINVVSLMSRVAIEGEWIPAKKELELKPDGYVLSERESTSLDGVFVMVDMMQSTLKELEAPLRMLRAPISSRVYDGWHEINLFLPDMKKLRKHCREKYLAMEKRVLRNS